MTGAGRRLQRVSTVASHGEPRAMPASSWTRSTPGATATPAQFVAWREQARTALRVAFGEADKILERFDKISYAPRVASVSLSGGNQGPEHAISVLRAAGVRQATAMLRAALTELEATVDPEVPSVDVNRLHPWFSGHVAPIWHTGQHPHRRGGGRARDRGSGAGVKLGLDDGSAVPVLTDGFW